MRDLPQFSMNFSAFRVCQGEQGECLFGVFFLIPPLQYQPVLKPNDVFVCFVLVNFMYVLSTYPKIDLFMVSNGRLEAFVTLLKIDEPLKCK